MWPAIMSFAGGVALALLARVPALTRDGRRIARIKADAELLEDLPAGSAHDSLRRAIGIEIEVLLKVREAERDRLGSRQLMVVMLLMTGMAFIVLAAILAPFIFDPAREVDNVFSFRVLSGAYGVYIAVFIMYFFSRRAARIEKSVREKIVGGAEQSAESGASE